MGGWHSAAAPDGNLTGRLIPFDATRPNIARAYGYLLAAGSGQAGGRRFALWERAGLMAEPGAAGAGEMTLEEVISLIGDRWDCRQIAGGFVAIPRRRDGSQVPRVERTPALLLAKVRAVEARP